MNPIARDRLTWFGGLEREPGASYGYSTVAWLLQTHVMDSTQALVSDTQQALQSLGVCELPEEWVATLWRQSFCEGASLPPELESSEAVLSEEAWSEALRTCRRWLLVGDASEGREEDEG